MKFIFLPEYLLEVPSKKVPCLLTVLSRKLSGITNCPLHIDSDNEPQAVDART